MGSQRIRLGLTTGQQQEGGKTQALGSSSVKGQRGQWRWAVELAKNKPNRTGERRSMRHEQEKSREPEEGGSNCIYTPLPEKAQTTLCTIPPSYSLLKVNGYIECILIQAGQKVNDMEYLK